METFKCGKGFVATPSEDGSDTLVPFFIQVRDKDIIWSIDDFPKELVNLYCTNNDPIVTAPVKEIKINHKGWNVTLSQEYDYTATKSISIGDSGIFELSEDMTMLETKIELPFNTKYDLSQLTILCTVDTEVEELLMSLVTVSTHHDVPINSIKKFKVRIKCLNGEFIKRFTKNPDYVNSYLNIMVKGKYVK